MKKLLIFALTAAAVFTFASCGKDSAPDPTPGLQTKTGKFTITINNAKPTSGAGQHILIIIQGTDPSGNSTIWKVNGVTRDNEHGITLDNEDFIGGTKTYVLETLRPVQGLAATVQCYTVDPDMEFTMSFKSEIDGVVKQNDQNVQIKVNQDYNHDYTYL